MHKKLIFILLLGFASIILKANSKQTDYATLYNNAKYAEVINLANKTIAIDSTNFEAWYYKGLSEQALYKFSEAVNSFEKAVAFTGDKATALFLLGNVYELAGNSNNAVNTYKKLLFIDSLHIPAKAKLAKVYKSQKEYENAIKLFLGLVKLDTANGYFYSQLAYCCKKSGLKTKAVTYYEKAIELNPQDLESGKHLITELINQKYYEYATLVVDSFLTRFPQNIYLLKHKAYIYAIGGNYLDAVNGFKKVAQLGDSTLFTCKYYGQSLYNNGEYEKAVFWLGRFLDKKPSDFQNQFIMGLACQFDYQYKKSIEHLSIALFLKYDKKMIARIYTETGNTWSKYGDYLGFRDSTGMQAPEKYKLAIDNYLLAEELMPDDFKIYKVLGVFYETKMNDAKIALYYFEKYYKELDTDKINRYELIWIKEKIKLLKEEVHFIGE